MMYEGCCTAEPESGFYCAVCVLILSLPLSYWQMMVRLNIE